MEFDKDPYFVSARDTGKVKTQIVRDAPQRITRAAAGSRGKDVAVETVSRMGVVDNWISDLEVPEGGKESGFAEYVERMGGLQEGDLYPIEHVADVLSPSEERKIIESRDAASARIARVHKDPVSGVPDNWAAMDRLPESDKFFGKDKDISETETAMNRAEQVDRGRERVDYKKSKAVPIKMVRR